MLQYVVFSGVATGRGGPRSHGTQIKNLGGRFGEYAASAIVHINASAGNGMLLDCLSSDLTATR